MGSSATHKILAHASHQTSVEPGENVWVDVDLLMTHDICGPGSIDFFHKNFGSSAKVWDPSKIVIIPDHYIFTENQKSHENIARVRKFVKEQGITNWYDVGENFTGKFEDISGDYQGVCHSTLAEKGYNVPGTIIFGTDSHTCTSGAFGCFSSGIGDVDAALIMGTGKIWIKVPYNLRVVCEGIFPAYIMAKDLILQIIGDIGIGGATYHAMEFAGDAIQQLNIDEKMTLTNMVIEAGATNGIIEPNDEVIAYLKERGKTEFTVMRSDADAVYQRTLTYTASELRPVVARPHSPQNHSFAEDLKDVKIDRSYIGSCTGGKITDFIEAARILDGKKVSVDTFIVPATQTVYTALFTTEYKGKTLADIFTAAGALGPFPPGCQACLGGPPDTIGHAHGNEVVISTTNRNFQGRMGSLNASIYLASPLTCAASALKGYITDPREYM